MKKQMAAVCFTAAIVFVSFISQKVTGMVPGLVYSVYANDSAEAQTSSGSDSQEETDEIAVGDIVTFGHYELDNNLANGEEPIEWIILAKENGKILLLTKKALFCQTYYTRDSDISWDNCSLRTWLNDDFYEDSFSETEQKLISVETISTDKNPRFDTSPGKKTEDRFFLLSLTEVQRYLTGDDEKLRRCEPTEVAVAQGAFVSEKGYTRWWLRTPGSSGKNATGVNEKGKILGYDDGSGGLAVTYPKCGVRPAVWVNGE